MRLLALETSGLTGSVATLEPPAAPRLFALESTQRSARSLAPAVRRAIEEAGRRPNDVDVVAVTAGPGSFTGLRIGVTTAKTLAYALGADLVAVDTLDVLARQTPVEGPAERLHAVLDAHRNELFAASFLRDGDRWVRQNASQLVGIDAWLAALQNGDLVTGPIVSRLAPRLPTGVFQVDESLRLPSAAAVAQLAAELHAAGRRDDLWTLTPWYGRLAAAEEKRLQKP